MPPNQQFRVQGTSIKYKQTSPKMKESPRGNQKIEHLGGKRKAKTSNAKILIYNRGIEVSVIYRNLSSTHTPS